MSTNIVTQEHIDDIFKHSEIKVQTVFDKTTVVSAKLPNGFVIVESTGCVDPANYSEEIGKEICIERIKNKIWELEGYLLQDKLA
ncbi:Gp49 family protein [Sporolactobacillus kofuensis]|uniref:Gp49 family protein n=1 Tax=Sporolactobacillus kofuensis TaxID=269672 RepID=A0ABW1WC93_9BACL|nr:Gp49 family protein [Sporolactobacillus kofuensis]MCO7177023.1 Gp49 family protein [Sporolactobacillus kofuensis]